MAITFREHRLFQTVLELLQDSDTISVKEICQGIELNDMSQKGLESFAGQALRRFNLIDYRARRKGTSSTYRFDKSHVQAVFESKARDGIRKDRTPLVLAAVKELPMIVMLDDEIRQFSSYGRILQGTDKFINGFSEENINSLKRLYAEALHRCRRVAIRLQTGDGYLWVVPDEKGREELRAKGIKELVCTYGELGNRK